MIIFDKDILQGSGNGTIDSSVASNVKGPGFESSHRQLLLHNILLFVENTKIKRTKVGREWLL